MFDWEVLDRQRPRQQERKRGRLDARSGAAPCDGRPLDQQGASARGSTRARIATPVRLNPEISQTDLLYCPGQFQ